MIPVVCSFAPASCFLSSTVTARPLRASAYALASPAKLAPTITQSVSKVGVGLRIDRAGAPRPPRSVREGVDDVVDVRPHALRGVLLGIARRVGMLHRVAEVHVVADRDHDAALIVVDAAPARRVAVLLVGPAAVHELRARDLLAVVEIPERVEDLIGV